MLTDVSTFFENFHSTPGRQAPMEQRRVRRETFVATIRASCPTCGDVELTSKDVTVLVCVTNNEGSYAFQCPRCRVAVSKNAEPKIVDLLVSSGVRMNVWQLPAELDEPRDGDAISYDDLLEFHFELQQEDWMDKVSAMISQGDDR